MQREKIFDTIRSIMIDRTGKEKNQMPKQQVSIALDQAILDRIGELSAKYDRSRSYIINECVKTVIDSLEQELKSPKLVVRKRLKH